MKTSSETKAGFAKRRPWLFLSLVALGFVGVLALITVPSILKYMAVRGALTNMRTQIVSAGGVALGEPQTMHGGLWWFQNLCVDNPCPTIKQDFLVPLRVGKEEAFMREKLLATEGYKVGSPEGCEIEKPGTFCLEDGTKGKLSVSMVLDPVVKWPGRLPSQDVSPKVWRTLSITSY